MITLGDIASWIIVHRSKTSFKDLTYEQIVGILQKCSEEDRMLVVVQEHEEIVGVITFILDGSKKELYVTDILTTKFSVVTQMMNVFLHKYPDYTIKGRHRSGRIRHFKDPIKLRNRLNYGC